MTQPIKRTAGTGLFIGALGVVFGDIGTSPLYALPVVFGPLGLQLTINPATVYGIVSLIIWSIMLVVSVKYVGFIMKAGNRGEGGILALTALVKTSHLKPHAKWLFITLGIAGLALFYGDSVITPAISVLSAVEGLHVVAPQLSSWIVPIALIILTILFGLQKYGTGVIGRLFGPVMLAWFITIGAGGLWQIAQHPEALQVLSPLTALSFFVSQPAIGFIAMTAVVLAITGAEALYADMGHFGRQPISRAWFFVVFPALALCYTGQGALLLHTPYPSAHPLFLLFPTVLQLPVVILATLATLIASQSVISGAFSLTRQAIQLNFLPRMLVRHTSLREAGQVYLPFINGILFVLVVALVIYFGSSQRLAGAFGVAVSTTLAIDTLLFLAIMRGVWQRSLVATALAALLFIPLDLLFVSANLTKIVTGGWFPLGLALLAFLLISTWRKGQHIISKKRQAMGGRLQPYINTIHNHKPPLVRVPGQSVFIGHHPEYTPLALRAAVQEIQELHEKVVIVSVQTAEVAHVPFAQRAVFDPLQYLDGISQLQLTYGFHDTPDIPKTLVALRGLDPELDFGPYKAVYFISNSRIVPGKAHMARWRKALYRLMSHNALSASDYYKLPIEKTVEIRPLIPL